MTLYVDDEEEVCIDEPEKAPYIPPPDTDATHNDINK